MIIEELKLNLKNPVFDIFIELWLQPLHQNLELLKAAHYFYEDGGSHPVKSSSLHRQLGSTRLSPTSIFQGQSPRRRIALTAIIFLDYYYSLRHIKFVKHCIKVQLLQTKLYEIICIIKKSMY